MRQLETDLGVALVTRSGREIILTSQGHTFAREISEVLVKLRQVCDRASANKHELTIACTHEVSHLVLMPRYAALKRALGRDTHIRIMTCEYRAIPDVIDAGADIVFEYRKTRPRTPCAAIAAEEILPVAAPDFLASHSDKLRQDPDLWQGIPRLSLTKENSGWATWKDWLALQGLGTPDAPEQMFDNHVYALEAATLGSGLVLAWRGFAERYLASGQLVPVRDIWLKSGPTLYAVATPNGQSKQLVRKCVKLLSGPIR